MTSPYRIGDTVDFRGNHPREHDRGTVVASEPGHMVVRWDVADETHEEDPEDERISLFSRS